MDCEQQYLASDDQLRRVVQELLQLGIPGGDQGGLRGFHLAPGSSFAVLGRRTELACFAEAFGETIGLLTTEYRPYEKISGFFVVIDLETRLPAASCRYIDGGMELNPTLRDLEGLNSMPEVTAAVRALLTAHPQSWDLTTMEVFAAYRGHHGGCRATGLVGRMLILASAKYQVPVMSLVASEHMQATIKFIGIPMQVLSQTPLIYLDVDSFLPTWLNMQNAATHMLAYLDNMRGLAPIPQVAQELPTLETLIRGIATGEGYDEFLDISPR